MLDDARPLALADAIRALSMDAVEAAKSGHPGMPMGMAEIGVAVWTRHVKHDPAELEWFDRDRFVLSNGHGSMLLYSLLHLTGYDLLIDDLKAFRQLHSRTPGHPEFGYAPGVETTTGPLGQGIANAVGMAIAERVLAAEFNRDGLPIVDHHTAAAQASSPDGGLRPVAATYLIGLDYGSESARGVLIDVGTGRQEGHVVHPYRHGVATRSLNGMSLPDHFVLQVAGDYVEAAEAILGGLARGRTVAGIGIDFTASSPMPAKADGRALSEIKPCDPHAYVKLWKHSAQPFALAINERGGDFLAPFGGKVSGEWMLAKAAEIAADAPETWTETDRFIEAGDWLVWQLTGFEARSLDFASYKMQFSARNGSPEGVVPGLDERIAPPFAVGTSAGGLSAEWREKTGIEGPAAVAVASIDSHVVLPAVGAVEPGVFVGALGTSAGFLVLDGEERPLPKGLEGAAYGAVLPGLWCYEAGQAAFGDMPAWYVRTFPKAEDVSANFAAYNAAAAEVPPGSGGLLALDWFSGNRIPHADNRLSGLLVGMDLGTSAAAIYRALLEALCYGTRSILDIALHAGVRIDRVVLTSGLARSNPFLLEVMANVLGRPVDVPDVENPTALGAAIHGAVAAGIVADFAEGAARFGAKGVRVVEPDATLVPLYERLYAQYRAMAGNEELKRVMHALHAFDLPTLEQSRYEAAA